MKSSPKHGSRSEGVDPEEAELLMDTEAQRRRGPAIRRQNTPQQAAASFLSSYFSRRFMSGFAMLFPVVVTVYATWWFLEFFDAFFSPLFTWLFGFHVFGLGFLTSMAFIFVTGVFTSSWIGGAFLGLGEYIIRKLPLVKHIYSAAKQVSTAVSPDEATNSFRDCVLVRHPRDGSYAFGFITGQTTLQTADGDKELFAVFIPTNHVYVGDVILFEAHDIIKNNLSVREGIEIVVSVGMGLPSKVVAE